MGQLPVLNRLMKCLVSAVSLTICLLVVYMIKLLGFTGFGMFGVLRSFAVWLETVLTFVVLSKVSCARPL